MNRRIRQERKKETNVWDFFIALGNGFVNLLKLEKIVGIVVIYLLLRDVFFIVNFSKGEEYQNRLIDSDILVNLLSSGDNRVYFLIGLCICLVIIIVILIFVINFVYVREIKRLADERSRLMHDIAAGNFEPLKKHNSSKEKQ